MKLKPADVLIVSPGRIGPEHYIVYWGKDADGTHYYLENDLECGVRWVTEEMFVHLINDVRLRLFDGSSYERNKAIKRCLELAGAKFDFRWFNCENFANYIQYGVYHLRDKKTSDNSGAVWIFVLAVVVFLFELF